MRKRVCEIIAAVFLMLLIVSFAQNLEETDRAVQEAGELSADTVGQFFQMMDMLALQKEEAASETTEEREEEQEEWRSEAYLEILEAEEVLAWEMIPWPEILWAQVYDDFLLLGGEYIAVRKESGKYGIMDGRGNFTSSDEYDSIAAYSEHMACACNDGTYYYLDEDGQRLIEGAGQEARSFHGARAAVRMDSNWGFIDPGGQIVISCQYEQVHDFQEDFAAVRKQDGWGYIDYDGRVIVPCQYDEARDYNEGLAAVRKGNLWGFVDQSGEIAVACQYDEVKDYSEGFAAVKRNDKWGYVDPKGQLEIGLMYDDAGRFSEGKAAVMREGYTEEGLDAWAYIDSDNAVVIEYRPYYASGEFRMNVGEFHDGLAFVTEGMPYIINDKGEYVLDDLGLFIEDYVYDPKYKAIPVYVYKDKAMQIKTCGLIGTDGRWLIRPGSYVHMEAPQGDYVRAVARYDDKEYYSLIRLKEKFTEGLSGYHVSDLEGIQRVVLQTDAQEDIDKIGQITSLKQLNLHMSSGEGEGGIENLDAIGELENLEELDIFAPMNFEELDTAALGKLKNLKEINLGYIDFDISFLSGMEALEEVWMDRCKEVEDLSMFTGLRNLKDLNAEYVDMADLRSLQGLEQLEEIYIQAYDIYGFEALETLPRVKSLCLYGYGEESECMDMAVLKNMEELKGVMIVGIPVEGAESLQALEHLESVSLIDTGIEDIEPLMGIPNLKSLDIYGNENERVKEQAEEYQDLIEYLKVSDEMPQGL